MGRLLTEAEWAEQFRVFERSALRLELQHTYSEPDEREAIERFAAGDPIDPMAMPGFREWFDETSTMTAGGCRRARVRVIDDPPSDSQRWEMWLDPWNGRAGEEVRYLSRSRAHEIGLLPAAGHDDWWLFDEERLLVMRFDADGNRVENELVTDPERIEQAQQWWDLAVRHSTPAADRGRVA